MRFAIGTCWPSLTLTYKTVLGAAWQALGRDSVSVSVSVVYLFFWMLTFKKYMKIHLYISQYRGAMYGTYKSKPPPLGFCNARLWQMRAVTCRVSTAAEYDDVRLDMEKVLTKEDLQWFILINAASFSPNYDKALVCMHWEAEINILTTPIPFCEDTRYAIHLVAFWMRLWKTVMIFLHLQIRNVKPTLFSPMPVLDFSFLLRS